MDDKENKESKVKILEALKKGPVTVDQLKQQGVKVIGANIAKLRKSGYNIKAELHNKKIHSYRLVRGKDIKTARFEPVSGYLRILDYDNKIKYRFFNYDYNEDKKTIEVHISKKQTSTSKKILHLENRRGFRLGYEFIKGLELKKNDFEFDLIGHRLVVYLD